ncbi:hypothetical protein IY145_20230 [Methylosinus sp. H3A]|uniref:GCG_CRPN prefix-to-repeats domain-containing protein n=1 Tax=Methylosinus sp. H3A TaxID=2785786 RepID=UPI0018C2D992|nr:hypothetical protein [Methylosinus sp. H3A]MBG0811684.1 hypothetical protein [Methylosinus sp. H3A]
MKFRLAFVAALALAGVEAPAAMAMPAAPLTDAAAAGSLTQEIGGRCGPGWHVDPWGRCVPHRRPPPPAYGPRPGYHPPPPAYGPRPGYHPPPAYGPRPGFRCGPGFHVNQWGRCAPNHW